MTTLADTQTRKSRRARRADRDADATMFGDVLKSARVDRGMSIDTVARVTAVPKHLLEKLEASELDSLPADVFVRGYIAAYTKAVGIDSEEALRQYRRADGRRRPRTTDLRNAIDKGSLGKAPSTVRRLGGLVGRDDTKTGLGAQPPKAVHGDSRSDRNFLPVLRDDERDRRGVTLAVVIIVIVATLTMSYLLRRPSQTGDDFTMNEATPAKVVAMVSSDRTPTLGS